MKSLHNLIDKATRAVLQQDRQIKQVISQIVPANTLTHINFCRLEAGRLRITVDNAIWVPKLRFNERQIVDLLRNAKLDVVTISLHVAPAETPVKPAAKQPLNRKSNKAALAITRLADSTCQQDEQAAEQEHRSPDAVNETAKEAYKAEFGYEPGRTKPSIVRKPDDRLRQELLKLAAKLRE